jgi:hypothetical protein
MGVSFQKGAAMMFARSVFVLVALQAGGMAQAIWTQVANGPARYGHAMAYDAARQRVVLFGGSSNGTQFGDTWEWNGTSWLQLAASGPSARTIHAMAYDAASQRVVLFGGIGGGIGLGDTWEWDGTNWVQRTPAASPSPRSGHAMAYDAARQRVVLFGGGFPGSASFASDTWEWNGTDWVQRTPVASPSARSSHAMAYDSARQRLLLFGGSSGSVVVGDTWEWDGTNWLPRFPWNYPSPRFYHAMAYDAARQRVVVFGGIPGSGSLLGDTWEWDGTNWVQRTTVTSPSRRCWHGMAYDVARQGVVLFGGLALSFSGLGDTWTWSAAVPSISASATAYGAGCGSPALGFVPDTNGRPLLGQTGSATIVNAPTPVAAVAMGWSNQFYGSFALPVTLAGIGMPGCDLQQSADMLGLGTSPLTPSTLSFSLTIPNVPSLLGSHVYAQAYGFAPGANPLQIIISNGIDWLLGNV